MRRWKCGWRGEGQQPDFGASLFFDSYNFYSYGSLANPARPTVLLSRSVPQDFRDRGKPKAEPAPSATTPASGSTPPPEPFEFLRSELPVSQWGGNWLGYSCYDAILVTEQEIEQMPTQVQLAIRRYIECGGTVLVHGHQAPDVFTQGGVADGKDGHIVGLGCATATLQAPGKSDSLTSKLAARLEGVESDWDSNLPEARDDVGAHLSPDG